MFEFMLTIGLLVIQILIYHFVKHRWVLLIFPALFFMRFAMPHLFRTYEGVSTGDSIKMNVIYMLIDSLYVLVLLVPLLFPYIKKVGWRIVIVVLLMLIVPRSHVESTNAHGIGSIFYSVDFHYEDATEPHVRFKFNFPRDRYAETDPPPRPDDSTRSLPSTTTQPSHA